MSDGKCVQSGDCSVKAQLPDKIRAIDIAFTKDENYVYSISFHGEFVLTIGGADSDNTDVR